MMTRDCCQVISANKVLGCFRLFNGEEGRAAKRISGCAAMRAHGHTYQVLMVIVTSHHEQSLLMPLTFYENVLQRPAHKLQIRTNNTFHLDLQPNIMAPIDHQKKSSKIDSKKVIRRIPLLLFRWSPSRQHERNCHEVDSSYATGNIIDTLLILDRQE